MLREIARTIGSKYVASAGCRAQFALISLRNWRASIKCRRFATETSYAEPTHCVCTFIGTAANYQDYRDILGRGLPQADDVAPDYKTQASALLYGDPYDWDNLNQPDSLAEYLQDSY